MHLFFCIIATIIGENKDIYCVRPKHAMVRRRDLRIFSKRQRITLRLLYAIGRPSVVCLSVCLSSVVCDVGAPYSGG